MVVQDEKAENILFKPNTYMFDNRDYRFFIFNYTGTPAEVTIDQVKWDPTIFIL